MAKPVDLTDAAFDEFVTKNDVVLVDCWAPWCGPCHKIAPIVEEVAGAYHGKVGVAKLNTDDNQKVPMRFGIMSIPTLLFFKAGQLVDQVVGVVPKTEIVGRLNDLVNRK